MRISESNSAHIKVRSIGFNDETVRLCPGFVVHTRVPALKDVRGHVTVTYNSYHHVAATGI